jgi:hypothetical protein
MAIKSVRNPIVGMEGWGRYLTTGTANDALPFQEETEEARQARLIAKHAAGGSQNAACLALAAVGMIPKGTTATTAEAMNVVQGEGSEEKSA